MSIDIITYRDKEGKLPWYLDKCIENKIEMGFKILELTPDNFTCRPEHCSYKHFRDICMPKLKQTKEKGIFICEGDVIIFENVNNIEQPDYPVWYGYKKKLCDYIVGNFLLWLPKNYYNIIQEEIDKKNNRLLYSDRFFTQLVNKNIIKLHDISIANEIKHYSNIIKKIRSGLEIF